jgi:Short C-terminal domain
LTSLMLCGLLLLGVVACGGGAEVKSEVSTTTVGQQFMDLKKALDSGAMTQEEYEKERKKILEN